MESINNRSDIREVMAEHTSGTGPTVLILPSLYLGLDLKDNMS